MRRSLALTLFSVAVATVLFLVAWFVARAAFNLGHGFDTVPYFIVGSGLAIALTSWFAERRNTK